MQKLKTISYMTELQLLGHHIFFYKKSEIGNRIENNQLYTKGGIAKESLISIQNK